MLESESKIQKRILDCLKSKNCYVVKVVRGNERGIPDILFCKDGTFNAIEVKAKGKKNNVTELQKLHLSMIRASGGVAFVADCLEDVMEMVK